jgi:hypothetical protein
MVGVRSCHSERERRNLFWFRLFRYNHRSSSAARLLNTGLYHTRRAGGVSKCDDYSTSEKIVLVQSGAKVIRAASTCKEFTAVIYKLTPFIYSQFIKDIRDVRFNSSKGNSECPGNVPVGVSGKYQFY